MYTILSSQTARNDSATHAQLLTLFAQLVALHSVEQLLKKSGRGFYKRVWCPVVSLWYLVWQRLNPQHTLAAVIIDARRGGADALGPTDKRPLSQRINSTETTAYSKARQRLPLAWVQSCFTTLAPKLAAQATPPKPGTLSLQLWDGSTMRLRPHGDIRKKFPPHRTRRKKSYWCVARVVVGFCALSGVAMAAQMASIHVSEQALAVRLILASAAQVLHLGDRNFGVWRVVRAALQSGGHALVRLTRVRANKLAAGHRLKPGLDLIVDWIPTGHDQVDRGLKKQAVRGRLVVVRARRRGHRSQNLFLFTTLLDATEYPPERLLALYGVRWEVELNFRTIKDTMDLGQLEVKSAKMAQNEFYAGLMAYNLVRGLMATAARTAGIEPCQLSFAQARTYLVAALGILWLDWLPTERRQQQWEWLLREVSSARLPRRKKPRPSEPRKQYHTPQVFPPMKCTRAQERRQLKNRK